MPEDFTQYLEACRQRADTALARQFAHLTSEFSGADVSGGLERLRRAMHYALSGGGKRIRPALVYATAAACGAARDARLDQVAVAVECIHAYSLVHDDLPAMDNDDLRRGQPTCHRAFDEATAILAGDGLQAHAFELLAELPDSDAQLRLDMIRCLAAASGPRGMVGGQALDLGAAGRQAQDLQALADIHRLKTGALIRAAVALGARVAGADDSQLAQLDRYAGAIGLAFQVQDDILDVVGDSAVTGKRQGGDLALGKATYPALLGLDAARELLTGLHRDADAALEGLDAGADRLRQLAAYIVQRTH
ncbi:MAG: (2E,6E)-farnesyl diphosphate synthase [Spongiibacteraceae bacterium]|jgi:geranylgeranyl pyrophosphate synthase|nr:(2E,6E)-farnesyl diphosphate synthase [Spongiibacteraceae bacterium]